MAHQTEHERRLWQLEKVDFGYTHDSRVLHSVSLNIEKGRIYGIMGSNGSGKTTLLDLMCGLLRPVSGQIYFLGTPMENYNARRLAKHIAMVPQEFQMRFPFTVREAVEMGMHPHIPRFSRPSPEDILHVDGVMEELDIISLANRPVTMLSGGEKQRVAAARALVQAKDGLLLDEATSNLDIYHSLSILDIIKERAREHNFAVIAAVHDINLASFFCDEFIFLYRRSIAAKGTPTDVLDAEFLKKIYGVDAEVRYDNFTRKPAVSFRMPEHGEI